MRDVQVQLPKDVSDETTRGNDGYSENAVGIKRPTISFGMKYDRTDSDWTAFRDAYVNDTVLACWVADGADAQNTEGFASNVYVTDFSQSQPLSGGISTDVTLVPESESQWAKHS